MKDTKMITISEENLGINIFFDDYEVKENRILFLKDNKLVGIVNTRNKYIDIELTDINNQIYYYKIKMGGD